MRKDSEKAFTPAVHHPPYKDPTPCMLCRDVGKLLGHRMREQTEKAGMHGSYRPFLHILFEQEGLTQLELARITHLTAPTVSVTLQKMEQDGLITRTPDPDDMRQIRVGITEKGRKLHNAVRHIITETEKIALLGITQEEQQVLKQLLSRICDNLLTERKGQSTNEAD